MKIAVIGWGSLLWKTGKLQLQSPIWQPDGPGLCIEYARKSKGDRLTLVLCDKVPLQRTYWNLHKSTDIEEAKANLAEREGIETKARIERDIHLVRVTDSDPKQPSHKSVWEWLKKTQYADAAIWTGLPPSPEFLIPSKALKHLGRLTGKQQESAVQYVRQTPPQIQTPLRELIRKKLGWLDIEASFWNDKIASTDAAPKKAKANANAKREPAASIELCPKADVGCLRSTNWKTLAEWDGLLRTHQISAQLFSLAKEHEDAGKEAEGDTFRVIAHALDMGMDLDDYQNPYRPMAVMGSRRSPQPTDFGDKHKEILAHVVSNTSNPTIRGRLADILWILRRDSALCQTAIESYLEKSKGIAKTNLEERFECINEIKRAMQLWRMTGAKQPVKTEILAAIDGCINISGDEPENYTRFFFIEAAVDGAILDDKKTWIQTCEKLSETSLKQKRFDKARDYLECAIKLAKQDKSKSVSNALLLKQTDLFELEAREMQAAGAAPLLLQSLFVKAIEANQEAQKVLGNRKTKVEQLHKELNEISVRVKDDLKPIGSSIDLSKPMKIALEALAKLSTQDGLIYLSQKTRPQSWKDYEESAKKTIKDFPLSSLFSGVSLDDKGRIISRSAGASMDNATLQKAAIVEKAYQHFQMQVLVVGTVINNGRLELRSRFDCDERIFDKFLECNPFVPKDRIEIFRQGFLRGFNGDWLGSMHILVPQIENSLRHLLENMGFLVTSINEEQIQQERDLNSLLYSEVVINALGEDMIRALRGLFTEKSCFNLRNRLAHGLLSSGHFDEGNHLPPYIWAFTLFLCLEFRSAFFSRLAASNPETGAAGSADKKK